MSISWDLVGVSSLGRGFTISVACAEVGAADTVVIFAGADAIVVVAMPRQDNSGRTYHNNSYIC